MLRFFVFFYLDLCNIISVCSRFWFPKPTWSGTTERVKFQQFFFFSIIDNTIVAFFFISACVISLHYVSDTGSPNLPNEEQIERVKCAQFCYSIIDIKIVTFFFILTCVISLKYVSNCDSPNIRNKEQLNEWSVSSSFFPSSIIQSLRFSLSRPV